MAQAPEDEKQQDPGQELFQKLRGQPLASQAGFFLNVYWEKHGADKDTVMAILLGFVAQTMLHPKHGTISSIAFMKVLQDLENKYKVMEDFPNDGPSISKQFEKVGIKKKGEISLLGALMAIYGEPLKDITTLPVTPANSNLVATKKHLADTIDKEESLKKQKAAFEKEIEDMNNANASAMKVMKKREQLKKVEAKLDDGNFKVQQNKDVHAAQKGVKDAEEALVTETEAGTDATNWLKDELKKANQDFFNFEIN